MESVSYPFKCVEISGRRSPGDGKSGFIETVSIRYTILEKLFEGGSGAVASSRDLVVT